MMRCLLFVALLLFLPSCGSSPAKIESNESLPTPVVANTPPVANADSVIVMKNSTNNTLNLLQNDTDADGDTLKIATTTNPLHGTIEVLTASVRYTPDPNFEGIDYINYSITDSKEISQKVLVTLYVTPQAQASRPIGVEDNAIANQNESILLDVLNNDLSATDNALSIKSTTTPFHGTLSIQNNKILYVPAKDYTGLDSFSYTPTNGFEEGNKTMVYITIKMPNMPPLGIKDSVSIYENNSTVIDVLANDVDLNGDKIMIDKVSQPYHGITYVENDKILYIPAKNYHGEDSFTYTPYDGQESGVATLVNIEIKDIDYAPVGVEDNFSVVSKKIYYLDLLANDSNDDNDTLSIKSITLPHYGSAVINSEGTITYVSNSDFIGMDSFEYVVTDESGKDSNATRVWVDVLQVIPNALPIARDDNVTIVANSQDTLIKIFANDSDSDGDTLSVGSLVQPQNGNVVVVEGGVAYTPRAGFVGEDSFEYQPSDGKEVGVLAKVTLHVSDANIAPVGVDDTIEFTTVGSDYIDVLANDSDANGDTLSIKIVASPSHGRVELSQNKVIYTPTQDYVGKDTFTYRPFDGKIEGNITSVEVLVNPQGGGSAIDGKVTFDRVPVTHMGLDYDNTTQEPSRGVLVRLYDNANKQLDETTTDDSGDYRFENLQTGKSYKVRIYAYLKSDKWDIRVVDNVDGKLQYAMEGSVLELNETTSIRDFNAQSGWNATTNSYSQNRIAAPFAILSNLYRALQTLQEADTATTLTPLIVNWSIDNKAASGDKDLGYIGTSHYSREDKELWILGDANRDTDEYDVSVVTHEFGHYLKAQVSRQDSLGGNHNISSKLDPRLAYEEGWCNAFAGIVHREPIYIDTTGPAQSYSSVFDLENDGYGDKGWFNEGSIHRILYDLFDDDNEAHDKLSLGFAPLYNVASNIETQYPAFLTIFTFITGLKQLDPSNSNAIDAILANEEISPIVDYYGSQQFNDGGDSGTLPPYKSIAINETKRFCTQAKFGTNNRLLNHVLIKVDIPSSSDYLIKFTQVASANGAKLEGDADFEVFKTSPITKLGGAYNRRTASEYKTLELNKGLHIIDLFDYNNATKSCFDLSIEKDSNFFEDIWDSLFGMQNSEEIQ